MVARKVSECKPAFDWKLFTTIMIALIGIWLRTEARLTKIETKLDSADKALNIVQDNAKKVMLLELRMNICEKAISFSEPEFMAAEWRRICKEKCGG